MKLAFYKGKGNWVDRLIRWRTKSIYSHVELVFDRFNENAGRTYWFSSSPRDGGVRFRTLNYNPEHWDFLPITGGDRTERKALNRAKLIHGRKYDYVGAILGAGLKTNVENPSRSLRARGLKHAQSAAKPKTKSSRSLRARGLKLVARQSLTR